MSVSWHPAIALALVLSMAPTVGSGQEQPGAAQGTAAKFKSAVDVVSVSAVVRDRRGRFVSNLSQQDFRVVEAGEPRAILDFRAESDGPVKLAMLFDVSGSMRLGSKIADARQAARHLLGALRPTDQAALFVFDSQLDRVKGFTSDFASLDAELDRLVPPFGQTSLYDAIAQAARSVAEADGGKGALPQRSAVVVLTDGIDTRSRLTPEQVTSIASTIDVPVYVVAVMASIDNPDEASNGAAEISGALRNLSAWTGGELFTASAPAHASIAARRIVEELRHQYVLAFEASSQSGWRPLQVSARDEKLVVRARAGYTAGGDGN